MVNLATAHRLLLQGGGRQRDCRAMIRDARAAAHDLEVRFEDRAITRIDAGDPIGVALVEGSHLLERGVLHAATEHEARVARVALLRHLQCDTGRRVAAESRRTRRLASEDRSGDEAHQRDGRRQNEVLHVCCLLSQ